MTEFRCRQMDPSVVESCASSHKKFERPTRSRRAFDGASKWNPAPMAPRVAIKMILSCSLPALAIYLLSLNIPAVEGVDCYKCTSRNGSNPACEDPFHNLNSTRMTGPITPDPPPNVIYQTPCWAGKKNKEGLFLASACIKLTGTFDATGENLVVRHCALDSGTLTQDTELARMSHCGKFQFEGDLLKGCVLACTADGCNPALTVRPSLMTLLCGHMAVLGGWILSRGRFLDPSSRL